MDGKRMRQHVQITWLYGWRHMEEELYGYSVTEIADFVGKKNEQYLERFKRLGNRRKFNFAAAFFRGLWFGYRKMWL